MRLEFESNVSALPVSDTINGTENGQNGSENAKEMLHEGIKAAQAGNRAQARHLLLAVTGLDPRNESAWLWLASISEYPEELLVFLKNVLDINPENQRAQQWTKATKSLLSKTFVQRGIDASKDDQREFASQCFNQAVAQDEENEMAWLWLASVTDSDEEKLVYLEKALTLDPENVDALHAVTAVWERFAESRLDAAYSAAAQGDRAAAHQNLDALFEKFPAHEEAWLLRSDLAGDRTEKISLLEKVLSINPANEDARTALDNFHREDLENKLQAAREAASESRREEAVDLLDEYLAERPESAEAWLLKAGLAEELEERSFLFRKVLSLDPENEGAISGLEEVRHENLKNQLEAAQAAANEGRRIDARELVEEVLRGLPESKDAWVLKAELTDDSAEKAALFEKVLGFDPENEKAVSFLESARQEEIRNKLQAANVAAIGGRRDTAAELLEEVLSVSPNMEEAWVLKSHLAENFDDKIAAFEKVLELNPENMGARLGLDSLKAIMRSVAPAPVEENGETAVGKTPIEESPVENEQVAGAHFEEGTDPNPTQELELPAALLENSPFDGEPVPDGESYASFDSAEGAFPEDYTFSEDPWPTEENLDEVAEAVEELFPRVEKEESFDESTSFEIVEEETEEPVAQFSESVVEHEGVSAPQTFFEEAVTESYHNLSVESVHQIEHHVESAEVSVEDFSPAPLPEVWEPVQEEAEVPQNEFHAENEHSTEDEAPELELVEQTLPEPVEQEIAAPVEGSFVEGPVAEEGDEKHEHVARPHSEAASCPFCDAENENQAYACGSCFAMLTLADLEMLLAHPHAKRDVLGFAVARIESERNNREFTGKDLKNLGIAHLNLKNYDQGLGYLQEAQRVDPNDFVLTGQVNALSIRLSEIRDQAAAHQSMMKGKTILVVDDSATVRKLIAGKLEKSGHEVICAVDGVDALEKMENLVPDLVLLDINMPRMDGYQVCKLIRNNHATENVPVVMISGKDGFFDKVRGRMSGTTGYITKPFGPETLMKALETYIKNEPVYEHVEE